MKNRLLNIENVEPNYDLKILLFDSPNINGIFLSVAPEHDPSIKKLVLNKKKKYISPTGLSMLHMLLDVFFFTKLSEISRARAL